MLLSPILILQIQAVKGKYFSHLFHMVWEAVGVAAMVHYSAAYSERSASPESMRLLLMVRPSVKSTVIA